MNDLNLGPSRPRRRGRHRSRPRRTPRGKRTASAGATAAADTTASTGATAAADPARDDALPAYLFRTKDGAAELVADALASGFACHLLSAVSASGAGTMPSLAAGAGLAFLRWILSPPDRRAPEEYYDSPRRFLLTGSASGMSRHLAKRLLRDGHFVCATDVRMEALELAFTPGSATTGPSTEFSDDTTNDRLLLLPLNVTSADAWSATLARVEQEWGGIDVCFNIAGVLCPAKIQDATVREIDLQVDVNIKGVAHGTRAAALSMLSRNRGRHGGVGHIVNFSSMGGLATVSGVTLYAASKFAVRGFSLAADKDLREEGLAVSVFMPDAVQTPMVDLQLSHDGAAMAFSGDILSLHQVEDCIMNDVLPLRPAETWLSSRARLARFGDIFGSSRAVALAEWGMKRRGRSKQRGIKQRMSQAESAEPSTPKRSSAGLSVLPDQTRGDRGGRGLGSSLGGILLRVFKTLAILFYVLKACRLVTSTFRAIGAGRGDDDGTRPAPVATAADIAAAHAHAIQGKTFIVTGASSGIGEETARALAVEGRVHVVVAARNAERGQAAADRINAQIASDPTPSHRGSARFVPLDLANFSSVDGFVRTVSTPRAQQGEDAVQPRRFGPIAGIVLNAGIIALDGWAVTVADGMERTLQVNHLSHQHLVTSLLEQNESAASKSPLLSRQLRVVSVSSWVPSRGAARGPAETGGVVHWTSPHNYPTEMEPIFHGAYGATKQHNIRFARELARRYESVRSYSLHPGLISTALGVKRGGGIASALNRWGAAGFWWVAGHFVSVKTISEGAATSVHCAVIGWGASIGDDVGGRGEFYDDARLSPFPRDEDNDSSEAGRRERERMDEACWESSAELIRRGRSGEFLRGGRSSSSLSASSATTSLIHDAVTSLACHVGAYACLFSVADHLLSNRRGTLAAARKINPRRSDPKIVQREKFRTLAFSAVVDAGYAVWLRRAAAVKWISAAEASWSQLCATGLLVFVWTDVHFYFTHRLMHSVPWLYSKVHYAHHESHNPNAWSSVSFHPVEALIFFSAYLLVFAVNLPDFVWYGFKVGMVVGPLHAHLGYDLDHLGVKGPSHHYRHHRWKRGNFGGHPSGIWDKLFGTEINDRGKPVGDRHLCATAAWWMRVAGLGIGLIQLYLELAPPSSLFMAVAVSTAALWLLLLDGALVVLPPKKVETEPKSAARKVFVIGLSRTGTTSISEALNQLGLHTHHFCGPLVAWGKVKDGGSESCREEKGDASAAQDGYCPLLCKTYADGLDGHTDLAPALVIEQLMAAYPDARFVYTTRPIQEWSKAMIKFTQEEPRKTLFKTHPTPFHFYNAMYGTGWDTFGEKDWARAYARHDRRVRRLFQAQSDRLLEISITAMGKARQSEQIWRQLCRFLETPLPSAITGATVLPAFPHRFVFRFSAIDQPMRQVGYMAERAAGRWSTWIGLMLIISCTVGSLRFWDMGQCTRACRVSNGEGGASNPKEGPMAFGNWFAPAEITGTRMWGTPGKCQCWNATTDRAADKAPLVDRIHAAIETHEQYWFQNTTTRVCATMVARSSSSRGSSGRPQTFDSAAAAHAAGASVSNCGQCSKCSSRLDVDTMHRMSKSLTKVASVGALVYLSFGEYAHRAFFRAPWIIGFGEDCSTCWLEATRCNIASCAQHCFFGWENPLSASSTITGTTELNACMRCDEVHCSAYYLQSCGANRRSAGVVTDIDRPDTHVCGAASVDAEERQGLS